MRILITGAAGFIGYHVTKYLLDHTQYELILVDNQDSDRSIQLKQRLTKGQPTLGDSKRVNWHTNDICDIKAMDEIFAAYRPDVIIHLAARAGVRSNTPKDYVRSNLEGFNNMIQHAASNNVQLFIYASSSSVYGNQSSIPFREDFANLQPRSMYARTKLANESIASLYGEAYGMKTIGLRLFNVYGEWGRTDMAYFMWTKALMEGGVLPIFGDGSMRRDMTYVLDVAQVIKRLVDYGLTTKNTTSIFNVGAGGPSSIIDIIHKLESITGKTAKMEFHAIPETEVNVTWADCTLLQTAIGYAPNTSVADGLDCFVNWYVNHFKTTKTE